MQMPKKIPTLIALLVLFFLIGVGSVAVQKITSVSTSASPTVEPKNVTVTNITDTACTIIWQTDEPATGVISLSGKTATNAPSYDDRDVSGKLQKYTTHSVTIRNLSPNTTYELSILSNGKKYPQTGKPYAIQTGPTINSAGPAFEPAYGIVKKFDGRPAEGAIILFSFDDSQTLSTLVRSTGSWMVPLNTLRTKSLTAYAQVPTEQSRLNGTVTVLLDGQKTDALIDSKNISPVPDITLGQTYDYRNYQAKNKTTTPALADAKKTLPSPTGIPVVLGEQTTKTTASPTPTSTSSIGGVSITAPTNNSSIVSTKPLIQGTGIAGKTVTITLGITKPQTGKATVGANGTWQYTPSGTLGEGKQSVTITTVDTNNKAIALTHNFTILKSGTQVLGDATPSATSIPTPTEEATLAAEPLPESGSTLPTFLLILVGAGLLIGGTIFFIL